MAEILDIEYRGHYVKLRGRSLESLLPHAAQVGLSQQQLEILTYLVKNNLIDGYVCPYKTVVKDGKQVTIVDDEKMKAELINIIEQQKGVYCE